MYVVYSICLYVFCRFFLFTYNKNHLSKKIIHPHTHTTQHLLMVVMNIDLISFCKQTIDEEVKEAIKVENKLNLYLT